METEKHGKQRKGAREIVTEKGKGNEKMKKDV